LLSTSANSGKMRSTRVWAKRSMLPACGGVVWRCRAHSGVGRFSRRGRGWRGPHRPGPAARCPRSRCGRCGFLSPVLCETASVLGLEVLRTLTPAARQPPENPAQECEIGPRPRCAPRSFSQLSWGEKTGEACGPDDRSTPPTFHGTFTIMELQEEVKAHTR